MDYGHSPAAFEAVADLTRHWPDRRVTAVFTAPGDRDDDLIRESGRVVARGLDRLVIKEDGDRRGRRPVEQDRAGVPGAALLARGHRQQVPVLLGDRLAAQLAALHGGLALLSRAPGHLEEP